MLTLATVTLPASSSEICSSAGAICLQGPHHSAQKSTSTGPSACSTSRSKVSSVTVTVLMDATPSQGAPPCLACDLGASSLCINAGAESRQRFGHHLFWNRHQL